LVESTVAERMNGRAPFVDATTCMEAVQTAQRLGDRRLEALAWGAVAVTQWAVGDEDSQASAEAALAAARETGDSRMVGDALSWLGMQRRRGDPDRLALYEEALEHLRRAGDLFAVSQVLTWLIIEQDTATYEDAMETRSVLNEQLKISAELGNNNANDVPVINLSLIECYLGNTDLADSLARSGTRQSRRIGRSPTVMLWPALTLGICAARRGQYERAAELLGVVESCEQPWYDKFGDTWQSSERQMQEEYRAQITAAIGDVEYARLTASGRALSSDDIVDLILERGERKPN